MVGILLSFLFGVLHGAWFNARQRTRTLRRIEKLLLPSLYVFLFFIGVSVGCNHEPRQNLGRVATGGDRQTWQQLRRMRPGVCLIPVLIALGTLVSTALASRLLPGISAAEAMGVGAGLGCYSLSSIMLTQLASPTIGLTALVTNLFREVFSLGFAPLLVRLFGPLGLIAAGASSSASVVLPSVYLLTGRQFVFVAVVTGVVLEFAVPTLIYGLCRFF
jgi:uncharacterized membrane protein YbjE (DUF340 family)